MIGTWDERQVTGEKPLAKFWIKFTIYECPLCGRGKTYKERMPLPKPEDPQERYEFITHYDWCER